MTILPTDVTHLIEQYGYLAVALAIGIESVGIPFPGEATLVAAAIYAGTSHRMDIALIIAAAAAGAIAGDNLGFLIGRKVGYRLLVRYGRHIGLSEQRIKLGQYLFLRHGGKVVFFGRFVAILRALAAVLAGAHGMGWRRFLVWNALGGIVWASVYGIGAWLLGHRIDNLTGPAGIVIFAVAAVFMVVGFWVARKHEQQLIERSERTLPGPISAVPHLR